MGGVHAAARLASPASRIVTALQIGIIATANYAFLNYLVLMLGVFCCSTIVRSRGCDASSERAVARDAEVPPPPTSRCRRSWSASAPSSRSRSPARVLVEALAARLDLLRDVLGVSRAGIGQRARRAGARARAVPNRERVRTVRDDDRSSATRSSSRGATMAAARGSRIRSATSRRIRWSDRASTRRISRASSGISGSRRWRRGRRRRGWLRRRRVS